MTDPAELPLYRASFIAGGRTFTLTPSRCYTDGVITVFCDPGFSDAPECAWIARWADLQTRAYWAPEFAVVRLLGDAAEAKLTVPMRGDL